MTQQAREQQIWEFRYSNGHRVQIKFPSKQAADDYAFSEGDHLLEYKYLKSYYIPEGWPQ